MGMRAIFAIGNDKEATITRVQWSTLIHHNMPIILTDLMNRRVGGDEPLTFDQAVHHVFRAMHKSTHIGCIDLYHVADTLDQLRRADGRVEPITFLKDPEGQTMCAAVIGLDADYPEEPVSGGLNKLREHPHAQDGVSLYYDDTTEVLHYFCDLWYVNCAKTTLSGQITAENVRELADQTWNRYFNDSTGEDH